MKHAHSPEVRPAHERLRLVANAIVVVGLLAAALVFLLSPDDEADTTGIAGGKMYEHNLALVGGRAAINAVRFSDWFASLWHGRPLAVIIVLLTLAIAGVCYWLARLMAIPPLPLDPPARQPAGDALVRDRHDPGDERGRDF